MIRRARRVLRRLGSKAPAEVLVQLSAVRHGETSIQSRLLGRAASPGTPPAGPSGISGVQALDDHLAMVLDALEAAAVPCAVIEAGTMRRRVVMITADQGDRARAALAHGVRAGAQVTEVAPSVLRVHSGDQRFGCDVELWPLVTTADRHRPDGGSYLPGTAIAPRPNRWVGYLEPAERRPGVGHAAARTVPTYEGLLRPHLLDVQFPIDVVYTWVDGADPDWLARKDDAWRASHEGTYHPSATAGSRFASHDELRYSLRSLETHADWVRQVFVVTDRQVPSWLRTDHPRLRVVDHREVFAGTGALPTFNSHAIEARLHHIDGLAEHFLYLNDDVFFGRPVGPELFFEASGHSRFFLTDATIDLAPPSARDLPVVSAGKQTRAAIEELFARAVTQRFQHVAHPQRRSVLQDLETRLPEELNATWSSPFRNPGDLSVPASLAHYFGYATGRAVPGELSYGYCDVTERRAPIKLQRLARGRAVDVFCLNETDTPHGHRGHALMTAFLQQYFPHPSSFERSTEGGVTA
jgi:hypothetical protein